MKTINVAPKSIRNYRGLISDELYTQIIELASAFKGARILHLNSAGFGGGVAEILRSEIPILQDLGMDVHWRVMTGENDFFDITKSFHNALQGNGNIVVDNNTRKIYERINAYNAHLLRKEDWDFVIIHDPQPMAIPYFLNFGGIPLIWRCHVQVSPSNRQIWDYLKRFLKEYDGAIFSLKEFIPNDLPVSKRFVIPPAIDPLVSKNKMIDSTKVRKILDKLGIDGRRPVITQISRFDRWKDPIGVIQAFEIAKKEIPELQLVLAGSMANDDPEGIIIFKEVQDYAKKNKDIKLLVNISDIQINALQTASQIVIQKSIKEGFGLTVSEAMYKETPVIGGNVGGIRLQIVDGKNGFLVDSPIQCAKRIVNIMQDTQLKLKMGRSGKQIVLKYFLIPRLVRDELLMLGKFERKETVAKLNVLF